MALRKTSHDGADCTSITSGIENEIKKAGSNISKIKKSSIKRKVQNFSHESDDGIIEPLLQTDKEKTEIANRSAKFLLNKTKTDSSYGKDNVLTESLTDKCSVSTPVQQANQLISNNYKGTQTSTSYVHGVAPIHNYMNTNIFSTYDVTKIVTTKSPILVEIDSSKPGAYDPSPLIFTTAKIHSDGKTKLMEPLQVTLVPILSTIEGSVIKAEGITDTGRIMSSLTPPLRDSIKKTCNKGDIIDVTSTKDKKSNVTTPITDSSNIKELSLKLVSNTPGNETKTTDKSDLVNSLVKSPDKIDKIPLNGQLASNTSTVGSTLLSNINKVSKEQTTVVSSGTSIEGMTSKPKVSAQSIKENKPLTELKTSEDKTKDSLVNNNDSNLEKWTQKKVDSLKCSVSVSTEIKSSTSLVDKIDTTKSQNTKKQEVAQDSIVNIGKSFSVSKKLQRQKNATLQDIQPDDPNVSKISKIEKMNIEKDIKMPNTTIFTDKSPVMTTVTAANITSPITSKPNNSTILSISSSMQPSKIKKDEVDSKSSNVVKSKLTNETPTSSKNNVTKLSTAPITNLTTETLPIQKPQKSPVSGKSDVTLPSSLQSSKTESVKPTTPVLNTSLPSYIVSTTKTKIGSTFTSNTTTSTTKSETSTAQTGSLYTKSAPVKLPGTQQSERPTVGISPTNGTKHPNFSKQTKSDTVMKDGRA